MTFLAEIESSEIGEISSGMKTTLMDEIALFQATSFNELNSAAEIPNELEIYFNTRFYARGKLFFVPMSLCTECLKFQLG